MLCTMLLFSSNIDTKIILRIIIDFSTNFKDLILKCIYYFNFGFIFKNHNLKSSAFLVFKSFFLKKNWHDLDS